MNQSAVKASFSRLSGGIGTTHPLLDSTRIALHDPLTSVPGIKVEGAPYYGQRSVVLPGVNVAASLPAGYTRFLASAGIGGRLIAAQPADNLLAGVNEATAAELTRLAISGRRLSFFQPTQADASFVNSLGLNWDDHVVGPTPVLADLVNNKAWQLGLIEREGLSVNVPEYAIVPASQPATIRDAAVRLANEFGPGVVKHPKLASGDGVFLCTCLKDVEAALRTVAGWSPDVEVIVQRNVGPHVGLSAQVWCGDDGPEYLGSTINITKGAVHDGNLITSGQLPNVPADVLASIRKQALQIAWTVWRRGYRGYLSVDFMHVTELGLVWFAEVNARFTGAAYPLTIALQAELNGQADWAVQSGNLKVTPTNFEALSRRLRQIGVLFDGYTGVLPICPALLELGKAMLYCVGPDPSTANELYRRVQSIFKLAA